MNEILIAKEELADSYIKEFKKELGFVKGGVFSMFEKRIKWLILSDQDLWANIDSVKLNFFEKLIVSISPDTAERIFKFIKEKQEKLQKAKTTQELNNLKTDVVSDNDNTQNNQNWDKNPSQNSGVDQNNKNDNNNSSADNTDQDSKDNERNSVKNWLITAGFWWATILGIDKYWKNVDLNEIKKLHPELDNKTTKELFEKMKWDFDDLAKNLEQQANNPKITKVMRNNIKKSAKEFEKAAKALDQWWIDAFESWRKLGNKLPESIIKNISSKESQLLLSLWDDVLAEIKNIDRKNVEDVKKLKNLLSSKWIVGISDETLKVLNSASNVWEVRLMVNCLSKASSLKNILRTIKSVALLDLVFLWFDVRMYNDTMNEADLMQKVNSLRAEAMRDRAKLQLRVVGVWWTALSIWAWVLATYIAAFTAAWTIAPWPGNVIWFVVWALVWGGAILTNYLIEKRYEKKEEYLKQEEDYKREYRSEIKQSIIQVIAAKEWNFNSWLRKKIETIRWNDIQTVDDGLRALIWLEEYENVGYDLLKGWYDSGLSEVEYCKNLDQKSLASYNEQKKNINNKIDIRMQYVKEYMYQNKESVEYKSFVSDIAAWKWISTLEQIIAKSETYAMMKDISDKQFVTWCTDIEDYKKKYWEKLRLENPAVFDKLEKEITDQNYLNEVCNGTAAYENIIDQNKTDPEISPYYDVMKRNAQFIRQYYTYKLLWLSYEMKKGTNINYTDFDYNYIESILKDPNKIDFRIAYSQSQVKNYFDWDDLDKKFESQNEVSDIVWQNVVYRIAKEVHWYKWSNDMVQLIWFFMESKKNNLWIYYDNKWNINLEWESDVSFELQDFETEEWYNRIIKYLWLSYENFDSVLDNVDESINKNYKEKIIKIIEEEKSYKKPEVKQQIEEEILSHIKINTWNVINWADATKNWYLDVPYYLIVKAKKSGIWNLEKFMFKYTDGKFYAISNWNYTTEKLDFWLTKTIINKEYIKKLRNGLSMQEMEYINYVEGSYKKLEQLRGIKWFWSKEDELDIPIEYEKSISQMGKKRKDFKDSLLYMDPVIVKSKLNDNYQFFYDYFDNMYLWLLSVVDKNKLSNDIDDTNYMSQAYNRIWRDVVSFDNKTNEVKLVKWLLSEWAEEEFNKLVDKKLYDNKTLVEIFKEDEGKWKWGAKQIVKSILESMVIDIDDNGNIEDIENWYFNSAHEKKLDKSLKLNLSDKKYFNGLDYKTWDIVVSPSTVQNLSQNEEEIWNKAAAVTKKIEDSLPNVDWSGKRWNIKFDAEGSFISSWNNNVVIEIVWEKIKIKWLNIELDVDQWIWLADIINSLKDRYPWEKNFYFGSRLWLGMDYGIYKSEGWVDTQILDLDTIKEKFPAILDNDNNVKDEFINYINSFTLSKYGWWEFGGGWSWVER